MRSAAMSDRLVFSVQKNHDGTDQDWIRAGIEFPASHSEHPHFRAKHVSLAARCELSS